MNVNEIISTAETNGFADFKFMADLNDTASDCGEEAVSLISKHSDVSVVASTPTRSATIVFVVPSDSEALDTVLHCWLTLVEEFIVAHVKGNSLDSSQEIPGTNEKLPVFIGHVMLIGRRVCCLRRWGSCSDCCDRFFSS